MARRDSRIVLAKRGACLIWKILANRWSGSGCCWDHDGWVRGCRCQRAGRSPSSPRRSMRGRRRRTRAGSWRISTEPVHKYSSFSCAHSFSITKDSESSRSTPGAAVLHPTAGNRLGEEESQTGPEFSQIVLEKVQPIQAQSPGFEKGQPSQGYTPHRLRQSLHQGPEP
jgi:hypothetical protein